MKSFLGNFYRHLATFYGHTQKNVLKLNMHMATNAVKETVMILLLERGSGCGSVSRAVASDFRGQRFESSHWQKIMFNINCQLY